MTRLIVNLILVVTVFVTGLVATSGERGPTTPHPKIPTRRRVMTLLSDTTPLFCQPARSHKP